MRFLIELDGVIINVAAAWHLAHQRAAAAVGWSRLDQATFWRRMRTRGADADFLPGAKPPKYKAYAAAFEEARETDDVVTAFTLQEGVGEALALLAREGPCIGVTLGTHMTARRELLAQSGLCERFAEIHALSSDPRRRPVELRALSDGDPRTVVVASRDAMTRSADMAGLFTVGIPLGPTNAARLHQAGVRLVFDSLMDLAQNCKRGAAPLVAAGLPPEALS